MRVELLDHVAVRVTDRDGTAERLCEVLGFHVMERNDRLTLVGRDARRGKVTLFDAAARPDPGPLRSIAVAVDGVDAVAARAEGRLRVEQLGPGEVRLSTGDGLTVDAIDRPGLVAGDLERVVLAVSDPEAARQDLLRLGFAPGAGGEVVAGVTSVRLEQGPEAPSSAPTLLHHLGLLVASSDAHRRGLEELGFAIEELVDAANTRAVFTRGPDGISLEYVEHKDTFALV